MTLNWPLNPWALIASSVKWEQLVSLLPGVFMGLRNNVRGNAQEERRSRNQDPPLTCAWGQWCHLIKVGNARGGVGRGEGWFSATDTHVFYLGNPRGEFGAVAGCARGSLCASSNVSMETKKRYLNNTPYVLWVGGDEALKGCVSSISVSLQGTVRLARNECSKPLEEGNADGLLLWSF